MSLRRTLRYYAQSVGCPHCESGGNDRFQRLRLVDRQYLCQYCVAGGIDEEQADLVPVRLVPLNLEAAAVYGDDVFQRRALVDEAGRFVPRLGDETVGLVNAVKLDLIVLFTVFSRLSFR
jgi:hypothetical protein